MEHTFSYWNETINATGYFDQPTIRSRQPQPPARRPPAAATAPETTLTPTANRDEQRAYNPLCGCSVTKVPHNLQLSTARTLDAPLAWARADWASLKGHSAISFCTTPRESPCALGFFCTASRFFDQSR